MAEVWSQRSVPQAERAVTVLRQRGLKRRSGGSSRWLTALGLIIALGSVAGVVVRFATAAVAPEVMLDDTVTVEPGEPLISGVDVYRFSTYELEVTPASGPARVFFGRVSRLENTPPAEVTALAKCAGDVAASQTYRLASHAFKGCYLVGVEAVGKPVRVRLRLTLR